MQLIRRLARDAKPLLPPDSRAHRQTLARLKRPVDYMRCAEFPLALEQLVPASGMRILDVSSPQWFSLCLAYWFPQTRFYYVNLSTSELDLIQDVAKRLDFGNISYCRQDVRHLAFDSAYFDRVTSLSVIEHVAPEVGGDVQALCEIRRVIKPSGQLVLSVPLKETRRVVKSSQTRADPQPLGSIGQDSRFFAREYDSAQFDDLVRATGFQIKEKKLIVERQGRLALDYWEWGPGKNTIYGRFLPLIIRAPGKFANIYVEDRLAEYYLGACSDMQPRMVNVVATLSNGL